MQQECQWAAVTNFGIKYIECNMRRLLLCRSQFKIGNFGDKTTSKRDNITPSCVRSAFGMPVPPEIHFNVRRCVFAIIFVYISPGGDFFPWPAHSVLAEMHVQPESSTIHWHTERRILINIQFIDYSAQVARSQMKVSTKYPLNEEK